MAGMQQKPLGRTGISVSAIGLGCGGFGGVGSAPECFGMGEDESQAFALMDAAWEMGITLFDTANTYGGGRSEEIVGAWLRARGPRVRDRVVLTTKVGNRIGAGPDDDGLSRRHVLQQIDASLRRLGVEAVDLYMLHQPDPVTPIEETIGVFDDLVRRGKIRAFGACNLSAELAAKWLETSARNGLRRIDWLQNEYNLIAREDERDVLPLCRDRDLGYTPWSPLCGGWLTGKYARGALFPEGSRMTLRPTPYRKLDHEETYLALDALRAHADAHGTDVSTLALAWVVSRPEVTAPIVGPRRSEHLDTARRALALSLGPDERDTIGRNFDRVRAIAQGEGALP